MNLQVLYDRLIQLAHRIQGYPRQEVVVELVVIAVVVFVTLRALRGTRGARAIKGMTLILICATLLVQLLVREGTYERLKFLYDNFLLGALLAMIVVFQAELRRALVRLGEVRLAWGRGAKARVIDEVVAAAAYLSTNKIGALIAFERSVGLKGVVDGGRTLDAAVSQELLNTIFWPGSALHDMGVVIQDNRITAAGVQFPLAEGEKYDAELGSRHRAALGLSQEADALVVVVSEETGKISLAQRGHLERGLAPEQLRARLVRGLARVRRWPWRWGRKEPAPERPAPAAPPRAEPAVAPIPSVAADLPRKLPDHAETPVSNLARP